MFFIPWQFWLMLIVFTILVAILVYVLIRLLTKHPKVSSIFGSTILSISFVGLLIVGFVIIIIVDDYNPCKTLPSKSFHYYHDHLKSLCVYREDLAECPKDQSELEAFNPELWQKLDKCAEVKYSFSEENQSFEFQVKDGSHIWRTTTALDDGFTFNR